MINEKTKTKPKPTTKTYAHTKSNTKSDLSSSSFRGGGSVWPTFNRNEATERTITIEVKSFVSFWCVFYIGLGFPPTLFRRSCFVGAVSFLDGQGKSKQKRNALYFNEERWLPYCCRPEEISILPEPGCRVWNALLMNVFACERSI